MSKSKIFDMVVCALFGAVCCICSVIAIPMGAVPFSLGVLGVIFTGVVLGPVKGLISVTVYLLLGLFLPLFSGAQNGISAYPGITGGYIWSYLIVVLVVGLISRIPFKNKVLEMVVSTLGCALGIVISKQLIVNCNKIKVDNLILIEYNTSCNEIQGVFL